MLPTLHVVIQDRAVIWSVGRLCKVFVSPNSPYMCVMSMSTAQNKIFPYIIIVGFVHLFPHYNCAAAAAAHNSVTENNIISFILHIIMTNL